MHILYMLLLLHVTKTENIRLYVFLMSVIFFCDLNFLHGYYISPGLLLFDFLESRKTNSRQEHEIYLKVFFLD